MEQKKNNLNENNLETNGETRLREEIFLDIIFKDILEEVESSLENAGYLETEKEYNRFMEAVHSLSPEDKKRAFSLPFELRERRFRMFRSENLPIEAVIEHLVLEAKDSGFTLGYHLSPFEIKKEKGKNGLEWKIKGTELDDRDEKPMAYYSLDYDNVYRKRHQKNLYIIRAHIGENSSHKYDPSNNWGRATDLSVVAGADFEKIDEEIKKRGKEILNDAKKRGNTIPD
ncbi:MAG: hypothetical protein WC878_00895 [Candidatus Paceibacterota bacterium]|jgi:hypothetical protein